MKTTTSQNQSRRSTRAAFSLVELMVVIVVIAILLAMLLPAINSARTTARVAAVVNEIKVIEKGLEDFKLKFGTYPPSAIRLHETAAGWGGSDTATRESLAFLRQIWPNFDPTSGGPWDINGNGNATDTPIDLDGAECLAFFLGGMCSTEDSTGTALRERDGSSSSTGTPAKWAPNGFSTNPNNPFARSTGSRIGPFFEFNDLSRLVNVDGDSMPEMLDSIPNQIAPLVYMSSYEGRGYDAADLPGSTGMEDVYRKDGSDPTDTPFNQKTYQIISPGFDFEYGTGGHYDGSSVSTSDDSDAGVTAANRAQEERDNITNFSGGMLN